MILCKITSGLGNQLFQYFNAYALSKAYDMELFLDISSYQKDRQRSFLLQNFDLEISIWKKTFFDRLKFKTVNDKQKGFQEIVLRKSNNYFLNGYWQSPIYFDNYKSLVNDKIFNSIDLKRVFKIEDNCQVVSVHVRRGDYINNPKINKKFNVCNLDYYDKAISLIQGLSKKQNLHFLFLSDDYQFISNNFNFLKNKTFLEGDINNPLFDFNVMMNCDHNIISNSTFSWWGAWLNNNPTKIIISPKEWFRKKSSNYFLKDLLIDKWIKI